MLPKPPCPAAPTPIDTGSIIPHVSLIVQNHFQTDENSFGLWKEYLYQPSYDPDMLISVDDLYCPHISTIAPDDDGMHLEDSSKLHYTSTSSELLLNWQNTGSLAKSNDEINWLVHAVLLHPQFHLDTL